MLQSDLINAAKLNIHTLPSYLFEYDGRSVLVRNMIGYGEFVKIIESLTNGKISPNIPKKTLENIRRLIDVHPLISPIEIMAAFDFDTAEDVAKFIAPLIENKEIEIIDVKRGWFIKNLAK